MPDHEDAPDVEFCGEGTTGSGLATDISWVGNNFQTGTSSIFEDGGRFNWTETFTVDIEHEASPSDEGIIYRMRRTPTGTSVWLLRWLDSPLGSLRLTHEGVVLMDVDFGGWPSSGTDDIHVSLAFEPNTVLSTGASDAYRVELSIWNLSTGYFETHTATIAQVASYPSSRVIFGAEGPGGSQAYTGDMISVRGCKAFHSTTETARTYYTSPSQPALVGYTYEEQPLLGASAAGNSLGDQGEFVGPGQWLQSTLYGQSPFLISSPVINEIYADPVNFGGSVTQRVSMESIAGTEYFLLRGYMWLRWVPPHADDVYVQLYVRARNISAAEDITAAIRCYSMTQPGPLAQPPDSPNLFEYRSVGMIVTADHGTNIAAGEYYTFAATLPVVRDSLGRSYFALAMEDILAVEEVEIKAVHVDPIRTGRG